MKSLFLFFSSFLLAASLMAHPLDSIGKITINETNYILHKVKSKETFTSLSKMYGVSISVIKYINNALLKEGEVVRIPFVVDAIRIENQEAFQAFHNQEIKNAFNNKKIQKNESMNEVKLKMNLPKVQNFDSSLYISHVLSKGDNLTQLAKRYNVTNAEILKANPGTDATKLKLGQIVLIPKKDTNPLAKIESSKLIAKKDTVLKTNNVKNIKAVVNTINCVYDTTNLINPDRKLALSNKLPEGVIFKLKNESTGKVVYLLVDGKLPDDQASSGIDCIISKTAALQLGAGSEVFKASIQ